MKSSAPDATNLKCDAVEVTKRGKDFYRVKSTHEGEFDLPREHPFTTAWLDGLPFSVYEPRYHRDKNTKGLWICVGVTEKTFKAVAQHPSQGWIRYSIGRFPKTSLEDARKRCRKLVGKIMEGMNPAEEKRRERKEEAERRKNRRTLKQLFDTFLESRILKPGTRKQYENLRDSAFGEMADMPVDEISEDIVRKWFLKMREESPAYAAQAARVLGAVFNSQALVNPCKVISRERAWPKQKRRTNFIGESDLPNFFKAIYELRTTSVHKDSKGKDLEPHVFQMLNHRRKVGADLIEFAVFTGLRKSEACGLRWDFIKFEDRILTIPDTKNGKPHTLPLTEHLETILKRRKEYADSVGSKWVFPAVSLGSTGHISEPRGIIDDIEGLGSVAFGMHDLRRTFDTHAMRQGIGYLQLKLLMNHSLTADVTAGYTQLTVDDLRPAMEAITRFFLSMMAKGQTLKLTNQQSA